MGLTFAVIIYGAIAPKVMNLYKRSVLIISITTAGLIAALFIKKFQIVTNSKITQPFLDSNPAILITHIGIELIPLTGLLCAGIITLLLLFSKGHQG